MSLGLSLKRYQSFHFSPSTKDIYKPNFIFSSDVVETVGKLHDIITHIKDHEEIIDLTDYMETNIEFNVNVELNMLMNRNRNLRPSDLVKDNLIFLAKLDESVISLNFLNHLILPEDSKKININPKKIINNEIFIVTLTLKVLKFLIKGHCIESIEFLNDENFGILLLCDPSLIDSIEDYIRNSFIIELLKSKSASPIESNSTINEEHDVTAGTETTFEVLEHDLLNKGNEDSFGDINNSTVDFMFLKDGTINEDDDAQTLVGKQAVKFPNLLKYNPFVKDKDRDLEKDSFAINVDNLRHNEDHEIDDIKPSNDQEDVDIVDDLNSDDEQIHIDDIPESPKNLKNANFPSNIKLRPSKTELKQQPLDENIDDLIPKKPSRSFNLPNKNTIKSPTFTIDQQELENFDYSGPSYIKGDKKFRYIKVGKVQKFVNLFEERVHEESEHSRSSSRPSSRSVSRSVSRAVSRATSPLRQQTVKE